jgi:hypothetical protein
LLRRFFYLHQVEQQQLNVCLFLTVDFLRIAINACLIQKQKLLRGDYMDIANSQSKTFLVFLAVAILLIQLTGCAGVNRRQNVRDGFLNTGLVKDAFLDVWGQPDKTRIMSGEQIMSANVDRWGGSFYKGKSSYEIWEYNKYGTSLVFSGKDLVNWSTTKSKEELQNLCKNDPICGKPKW